MVSGELFWGWQDLLALCRLKPDEFVVMLRGPETNPEHLEAARLAVGAAGARMSIIELIGGPMRVAGESTAFYGPTALTGNRPAIAAMKEADLVLDMMGIYRGSEQAEILATGTRILLVKEAPEIFLRLRPAPADKDLVKAAEARLTRAQTMRVVSDAGTDLHVRFGEYPVLTQYGYVDEPGRWDHCPSAFIARWPDEESSQGTVVLDRGDVILPFKSYVESPITLHIEDGYVRSIEGGFDARYLRDYMAKFDDPEGYAVSHLGWGLHKRAHWTGLGMHDKRQDAGMESRSFAGNFMFSTGPNAEAGGDRHSPCHLDIPMMGCSVFVDNVQITDNGALVREDAD